MTTVLNSSHIIYENMSILCALAWQNLWRASHFLDQQVTLKVSCQCIFPFRLKYNVYKANVVTITDKWPLHKTMEHPYFIYTHCAGTVHLHSVGWINLETHRYSLEAYMQNQN